MNESHSLYSIHKSESQGEREDEEKAGGRGEMCCEWRKGEWGMWSDGERDQ
jgi:hypothetical protein